MFARVLMSLAVLVALVGTAAAEKTKLAVLGLEVAGSIDQDSTSHGRLLTEMFRTKVNSSPRYQLAANSIKDLLDEKVANSCDTEAVDCMSKIGSKLKTQILIYGKIEKRPKDGKDGYQLSMKALDIDKRQDKTWSEWVPLSDFVDGGLDARVQRGFETLVGKDKIDTVITGNPGIVTPPPPPPPKRGGGFPWKTTAYVSTGLTLAAVGGFIYWGPLGASKLESQCHPGKIDGKVLPLGDSSSYETGGGTFGNQSASKCAKGPTYDTLNKASLIGAALLGGFAVFAYYEGFVSKKESPTQTSGRVRKKKQFAVTPILSPDGAGATFRLDW